MRLFVCVDPSPAAVADLGSIVDGLEVARAAAAGHPVRLAARDRWHITLAFLGEVPDDRRDRPAAALDAAGAALAGRPVTIRVAGGGTFGDGELTVLWAGIGGDAAALAELASAVRAQLDQQRMSYDERPFRPHLTISRPGSRVPAEPLARDVETLRGYQGPEWTVGNLHLVASEKGPRPVYTTLHRVDL